MTGKGFPEPNDIGAGQAPAKPRLIEGGLHMDTRGELAFFNSFNLKGVDRFYWIKASKSKAFRGWVGHRRDQKWFTVLQGSVRVYVVAPDNWACPSKDLFVKPFLLSASKPQVLHVPPGHATGSMDLEGDSLLVVFSSGTIEDSKTDEYRFAPDYWSIKDF